MRAITGPYELGSSLTATTFEHMVNSLAVRVLGYGVTTFGPGKEGGRDGLFEGEAPYPSITERWSGTWYIQSKFHAPHLSVDHHAWLKKQILKELKEFSRPGTHRQWPDVWIVATNIDPSGVPHTGVFDACRAEVKKYNAKLSDRFHIWGGRKILDLLTTSEHKVVASKYFHYITSGDILAQLYESTRPDETALTTTLVVSELERNQYAKLDQASYKNDIRPGINKVFVDLPFLYHDQKSSIIKHLRTAIENSAKRPGLPPEERVNMLLNEWEHDPNRSSIWFLKAGPGQGKSTICQLVAQAHRAWITLSSDTICPPPELIKLAHEIKTDCLSLGIWPDRGRVPIYIDLKDYAEWIVGGKKGILAYMAASLSTLSGQEISQKQVIGLIESHRTIIFFDGLDEVPYDVKTSTADSIKNFIYQYQCRCDMFVICSSRPQGYAGQFDSLPYMAEIHLQLLTIDEAIACAAKVIETTRSPAESVIAMKRIREAASTPMVQNLMRTPLQAHIMAVIVRTGQYVPTKKWELFDHFFRTISDREASRDLADREVATLLKNDVNLIRSTHAALGFVLHVRAEISRAEGSGASSNLSKEQFAQLVRHVLDREILHDGDENQHKCTIMMRAAEERLVLISTPDNKDEVRFDIRPLQEFFAAEYICQNVSSDRVAERIELLGKDSHWHEVVSFALNSFFEQNRTGEMHAAAGSLAALDQGQADPADDRFWRLLSISGLYVAGLFEGGAVEQNVKPYRMLDDRITAMSRAFPSTAHHRLAKAVSGKMRSVLIRRMLDEVQYNSRAWGAATFLWFAVADHDVECAETEMRVGASPLLLASVANCTLLSEELTRWQSRLLATFLNSDEGAEHLDLLQSIAHSNTFLETCEGQLGATHHHMLSMSRRGLIDQGLSCVYSGKLVQIYLMKTGEFNVNLHLNIDKGTIVGGAFARMGELFESQAAGAGPWVSSTGGPADTVFDELEQIQQHHPNYFLLVWLIFASFHPALMGHSARADSMWASVASLIRDGMAEQIFNVDFHVLSRLFSDQDVRSAMRRNPPVISDEYAYTGLEEDDGDSEISEAIRDVFRHTLVIPGEEYVLPAVLELVLLRAEIGGAPGVPASFISREHLLSSLENQDIRPEWRGAALILYAWLYGNDSEDVNLLKKAVSEVCGQWPGLLALLVRTTYVGHNFEGLWISLVSCAIDSCRWLPSELASVLRSVWAHSGRTANEHQLILKWVGVDLHE